MAEICLYRPRVVANVGQGVAASTPQHVSMNLDPQPAALIQIPKYGEPTLICPRLGQGAFRIGVTEVYDRRCAVTGERTLPILDAAHIRPYGQGGDHDITNGLLLRTDIHRLFDLGYVTVSQDGKFEVGRRLKDDFENGKHYYVMQGKQLSWPHDLEQRPRREFIEWHQSNCFLG
jgi:predicted restriction endonuclease